MAPAIFRRHLDAAPGESALLGIAGVVAHINLFCARAETEFNNRGDDIGICIRRQRRRNPGPYRYWV